MEIIDSTRSRHQAEALKAYIIGHEYPETMKEFTARFIRWENGREQGYAMLCVMDRNQPCLIIVFGEHRSCDSIFVDRWVENKEPPITTVSHDNDLYEEAYKNRVTFDYARIDLALAHIHGEIEKWHLSLGVKAIYV